MTLGKKKTVSRPIEDLLLLKIESSKEKYKKQKHTLKNFGRNGRNNFH